MQRGMSAKGQCIHAIQDINPLQRITQLRVFPRVDSAKLIITPQFANQLLSFESISVILPFPTLQNFLREHANNDSRLNSSSTGVTMSKKREVLISYYKIRLHIISKSVYERPSPDGFWVRSSYVTDLGEDEQRFRRCCSGLMFAKLLE